MRSHLVVASGLLAVVGCAIFPDTVGEKKTADTWRCGQISAPGGETLGCIRSAALIDPTYGDPASCTGYQDNPDLCPTSGSGTTTGGAGTTTPVESDSWSDSDGSYTCVAGAADCPPRGAKPGKNVSVGGRGKSGDDKSGNADEKSGEQSGATGETYDCRKQGKKTECVQNASDQGGSGNTGSSGGSSTTGGETGLSGGGGTTTTSTGKSLTFDGWKDLGNGTSRWCWTLTEVSGQDISNWVIGTGSCTIVGRSPQDGSEVVRSDPNSGLRGVKWNTGDRFTSGQFCVDIQGTATTGSVKFSVKAPDVAYGMTNGPVCQ